MAIALRREYAPALPRPSAGEVLLFQDEEGYFCAMDETGRITYLLVNEVKPEAGTWFTGGRPGVPICQELPPEKKPLTLWDHLREGSPEPRKVNLKMG